jgi:hypothetical protein
VRFHFYLWIKFFNIFSCDYLISTYPIQYQFIPFPLKFYFPFPILFFIFLYFIIIIIIILGVHCDIYKISYNLSLLNSLPPSFSFNPLFPIPGIVSTGLIFQFAYICIEYFHHIHPQSLFLISFPSHWCSPPRQDLFCLLVLSFHKKKIVFKLAMQSVSL